MSEDQTPERRLRDVLRAIREEHARDEGETADEAAARLSGPEDPASEEPGAGSAGSGREGDAESIARHPSSLSSPEPESSSEWPTWAIVDWTALEHGSPGEGGSAREGGTSGPASSTREEEAQRPRGGNAGGQWGSWVASSPPYVEPPAERTRGIEAVPDEVAEEDEDEEETADAGSGPGLGSTWDLAADAKSWADEAEHAVEAEEIDRAGRTLEPHDEPPAGPYAERRDTEPRRESLSAEPLSAEPPGAASARHAPRERMWVPPEEDEDDEALMAQVVPTGSSALSLSREKLWDLVKEAAYAAQEARERAARAEGEADVLRRELDRLREERRDLMDQLTHRRRWFGRR